MNEKFANFISAVFHPLLMPTFLLATLFYISPDSISGLSAYQLPQNEHILKIGFKENLLILIFLSTFLMPASFIYYLYKVKIISSLKMEDLSTRRIPYFLTFLLYLFFAFFLNYKLPLLREVIICIFSIASCLFLLFVISFFWKISAHMTGISGVLGVFISFTIKFGADNLFIPVLIVLLLSGIISAARLQLNAHTPNQILAGFFLGLLISISSTIIFI